jgi:hypothetical protein
LLKKPGLYLGVFCWGAEGEARVAKASTEIAKSRAGEKLDALRGVFPPSQKLKDITKCTFWVNFVAGKTLRSDKKAI